MTLPEQSERLTVYLGESDKAHGRPLYELIVEEAKQRGMAGATVLRGTMGFGAQSRYIHTSKILRLSEDLPMVIQIVDRPEKIAEFLPYVEQVVQGGMIISPW